MTTETMLTDEQIREIRDATLAPLFARAIEQAVLQSAEVQALRKKAAMVDYLEQHQGADISVLHGGEWEVCGGDVYGTGASLADAFDAAMEKQP